MTSLRASASGSQSWRFIGCLHDGQSRKEKVILNEVHFFSMIDLMQFKWNTCPQSSFTHGSELSSLTQQIVQNSSPLTPSSKTFELSPVSWASILAFWAHSASRHGRHLCSPLYPPHLCPHAWTFVQLYPSSLMHSSLSQTSSAAPPCGTTSLQKRQSLLSFYY